MTNTYIIPFAWPLQAAADISAQTITKKKDFKKILNTNLSEPTVGGHDLLPFILKHRQISLQGWYDDMWFFSDDLVCAHKPFKVKHEHLVSTDMIISVGTIITAEGGPGSTPSWGHSVWSPHGLTVHDQDFFNWKCRVYPALTKYSWDSVRRATKFFSG